MIHTDGIPTIANRKAPMAQFPERDDVRTMIEQDLKHVHEWPEHLHKPQEPCTKACPEAVCECGAKLVVIEPQPKTHACYWGVIGHPGHHSGQGPCHEQILLDTDPPYCPKHQGELKLRDALVALAGKTITEVKLGDYPAVRIQYDGGQVGFDADYDEDYGFEWRLA